MKQIEFNVFVVDEVDLPSEHDAETEQANAEFERKHIYPLLTSFRATCSDCGAAYNKTNVAFDSDTAPVMGKNGAFIDKPIESISTNDIVLVPINPNNPNKDTADVNPNDLFNYSVIVTAHDNKYLDVVCAIRECKNCHHLDFKGSIELVTKLLGYGHLNVVDIETKEETKSSGCGNNCTGCTCNDCNEISDC